MTWYSDLVFTGLIFTLAHFGIVEIEWYVPKWLKDSTEEL